MRLSPPSLFLSQKQSTITRTNQLPSSQVPQSGSGTIAAAQRGKQLEGFSYMSAF